MGINAMAPVPSPRQRPPSTAALSPSLFRISRPAGSADTWDASKYSGTWLSSAVAAAAAAAEIKPSSTTGIRYAAPPRQRPQSPARSRPPTARRIPMPSQGSGRCSKRPLLTASIFLLSPSLLRPAPRPVVSAGSADKSAAVTALLAVVFPIPISPAARISYPSSFSARAISIPVRTAASASRLVMAGSLVKFAHPFRIFLSIRGKRLPRGPRPQATPISTGNTSAPATPAIRHEQLSPLVRFAVTTAVTSCPVCVTPSSTTPLSAQNTTSAFFPIRTFSVPEMAASFCTSSSSTPRLPRGFATWLQRRPHRSKAPLSAGTIRTASSANRSQSSSSGHSR